jgi:hypothetical protein
MHKVNCTLKGTRRQELPSEPRRHQQRIGVILDSVPSHFPNDKYGLSHGTYLLEHADPRKGYHPGVE